MSAYVDITGQRFGRLIALARYPRASGTKGKYRSFWTCRCDCGQTVEVSFNNLTRKPKGTRSCGCLRSDASKARERAKNHPTHGRVLSYYKRNAKNRGVPFDLDVESFTKLLLSNCYYCGQAPESRLLVGKQLEYNGIDRLNNDHGHIDENVVSCCTACNRSKLTMTVSEFAEWVGRIAAHLSTWRPQ